MRLRTPTHQTEHYHWFTSVTDEGGSRVSGFLLRKGLETSVQCTVVSSDIQLLFLKQGRHSLIIINLYMPCEQTRSALGSYQKLDSLLCDLQEQYPKTPYYILGDTNAHLGKDLVDLSRTPGDQKLLGNYVLHFESNDNGSYLWTVMQHHRLAAATTMFDSSTLKTRYQAGYSSQLDHLLVPYNQLPTIAQVNGSWARISDHKLVKVRLYSKNSI